MKDIAILYICLELISAISPKDVWKYEKTDTIVIVLYLWSQILKIAKIA